MFLKHIGAIHDQTFSLIIHKYYNIKIFQRYHSIIY